MIVYKRFSSFPTASIFLILIINLSESNGFSKSPSIFKKFWNIGCEFSGVVSRVRRSVANPPPEEPNFDDPEELFNYLYPLADVKYGDDGEMRSTGSQRSVHETHSISSWLEDLMELWHSECNQRRMKRSAERREEYNKRASRDSWSSQTHLIRGRVDRKKKLTSDLSKRNSSLSSLSQALSSRKEDTYGGSDVNDDYKYPLQHDNAADNPASYYADGGYGYGMDYNNNGGLYKQENEETLVDVIGDVIGDVIEDVIDKEEDKLEDKLEDKKPTTTIATTTTTPAPAPPPAKDEDIFFSQYGGDIEYFFPLLSFGIPFDGEITLLGFHGFRGIFPY